MTEPAVPTKASGLQPGTGPLPDSAGCGERAGSSSLVLSGDFGDRLPGAFRLIDEGRVPVLVHAGTPDNQAVLELCRRGQRIAAEVVCLQPPA